MYKYHAGYYSIIYHRREPLKMNQETNPLEQFYRRETFRVKLPSRGSFYDESIIELDDNLEVGILPMTSQDEITLKNPDSLLTGKAIQDVLTSCVPAVKNAKKLLACDIDTLMLSIRRASYGAEADLTTDCPECGEENTYGIDIETLLVHTETLESSYEIVLPQGITVFLRPGTYETLIKQYKVVFENAKAQRAVAATVNEEVAMQVFSKAFVSLSKLNFELIVDAITKVIFTDAEGEEQIVTSKKHITDFIKNVDKKTVDMIDEKLASINAVGIEKHFDAVCKTCQHQWKANVEFNPVNFS